MHRDYSMSVTIVANNISMAFYVEQLQSVVIRYLMEGDYVSDILCREIIVANNIVSNIISSILRTATIVGCNTPSYGGRLQYISDIVWRVTIICQRYFMEEDYSTSMISYRKRLQYYAQRLQYVGDYNISVAFYVE